MKIQDALKYTGFVIRPDDINSQMYLPMTMILTIPKDKNE